MQIKLLHPHTPLPAYATLGSAGMDLCAMINEDIVIHPGKRVLIPTGLSLEIPEGFEVQIRPRSGLALKHGLTVLNAPGTIDSDYRGEVQVILINLGEDDVMITPMMRIAQMVMAPVVQAKISVVEELSKTKREADGFGSTGI